ncbi:hypothetical protein ACROYT_G004119 [Oculina patagonica]
MGQLVVRFKEWREKLELSHDKAKHASSQSNRPEQKSLTSGDTKKPNRDYGATSEIENLPSKELLKKLEVLECLLENQRKFLEDHDAKIQEIDDVINKLVAEQQKRDKQIEKGDDEQAESRDPWRRFEHHARILKSHEERLENNITKIEIIREMLEQEKGEQEKALKRKLIVYEEQLKKRSESYEKLKKEVEEQLQIQQKLQDNMLAGFIVGFVILVMICLLPRTLLAS